MIETAAQALYAEIFGMEASVAWEHVAWAIKEKYRGHVQAVIGALLDPMQGMVEAGEGALDDLVADRRFQSEHVYRAMLTTALGETP